MQVFDGIADHIDLPYGERVIGIGEFEFAPTPRPTDAESTMAGLWRAKPAQRRTRLGETEERGGSGSGQAATSSAETFRSGDDRRWRGFARRRAGPRSGWRRRGMAEWSVARRAPGKKYLLIETNEESVRNELVSEAETASQFARGVAFERPRALREDRSLRPHQEDGVRWLQTCSRIQERTGVLLADEWAWARRSRS